MRWSYPGLLTLLGSSAAMGATVETVTNILPPSVTGPLATLLAALAMIAIENLRELRQRRQRRQRRERLLVAKVAELRDVDQGDDLDVDAVILTAGRARRPDAIPSAGVDPAPVRDAVTDS